jgi:hypothetical protein
MEAGYFGVVSFGRLGIVWLGYDAFVVRLTETLLTA